MGFAFLLKSNTLRTLSCVFHRLKNIRNGETSFTHQDLTSFTVVQDYFLISVTFVSVLFSKGLNITKRIYSL